ncbi:carotenoid biosynthesis protein [Mucilaginibacter terrae]|uniref:Membrane protein n=1 Tax=Mucilaginibacter terrae TaxID=1955052 RepID=A0ABU3GWQ1_9SPHI|nr:carotenoid biosynthesis protein [Mucilaginibacter terrae]MDT3404188.1 putative membrane protein [Mucilaginibacter terrae]
MERSQGIVLKNTRIPIIIIILFHVVGLVGFLVPPLTPYFLKLVPFHLLLMLAVVLINHYRPDEKFWLFALLIFAGGYTAEWIGVHKHWIFGDYTYGKTLGVKVADIPLMIGVNWLMLVYATGVLMQRSRLKSTIARIITGAIVLVALDLLIEPVAIKFDYWSWTNGHPPLKNYVGWFGVSALFLSVFELFKFKPQTIVAPVLLIVQFVFFGVLQLA